MRRANPTFDDIAGSVIAVPPLARNQDLTIRDTENQALITHLRRGGVSILLYGGNANFYNIGLYEYADVLDRLISWTDDQTILIPSAGPEYGRLIDQAPILRGRGFPTVMVLPLGFPATAEGTMTGLRHFADRFGGPLVLYLKQESYLTAEQVAQLVDDGIVSFIKYAIVRNDPLDDAFLSRLVELVDRRKIISGMGEKPALVHLTHFHLHGFTSGSVCVAPAASTAILRALRRNDYDRAQLVRGRFLPLEDLRDRLSPIRVLHDAVTLAGIADMGPLLPLLSNLRAKEREAVREAARRLLEENDAFVAETLEVAPRHS